METEQNMETLLESVTRRGAATSVLQLRIYDLEDTLIYKNTYPCSDYLALCKEKDTLFASKLIPRCTVRFLDARRLDWRTIVTGINRQANLFHPEQMKARKWKVTYYDIADEVQAEEISDKLFAFNIVNAKMLNLNSVYCVLSACEIDAPDECFQVFCAVSNKYYNDSVIGEDGTPVTPPAKTPISLFEQALKRDSEETEQLRRRLKEKFGSIKGKS